MNWSNVIGVTNRSLCRRDFLTQVERAASVGLQALILREKDLDPEEYRELAVAVIEICRKHRVTCILHKYVEIAQELGCPNIHLPLSDLLNFKDSDGVAEKGKKLQSFQIIGASVHSAQDALLAERAGCTYITAGHVFQTDCKKDLPPRGLDFFRDVCKTVSVPVYGIGGIHPDNMQSVLECGAAGVCMMSEIMGL